MSKADHEALMDSLYEKATRAAQAKCSQKECADPQRRYVCTYHEGWADGFEMALQLVQIGAEGSGDGQSHSADADSTPQPTTDAIGPERKGQ